MERMNSFGDSGAKSSEAPFEGNYEYKIDTKPKETTTPKEAAKLKRMRDLI